MKKKIKKEKERDIIKLIYLHFLYRHSYFFSPIFKVKKKN
jgi:hypothetical protein